MQKGRFKLSADNAFMRFSPLKLARGELDTLYLEGAMIRCDLGFNENDDDADSKLGLGEGFTIPFQRILIPDGDIVFVRERFRRSLPLSGLVLKNEDDLVEATFSAGREGRSFLLEASLQMDTRDGDFSYLLELENFNEWQNILEPYLDLSLPEGSAINVYAFSGEGKGEIKGGKLTSIALVGSSDSSDGILPDGLLVNDAIHIGLRRNLITDHFEVAVSGHVELLDWRSLSVAPFGYVFHQGQDKILRGEVTDVAFSHGESINGLAKASIELDAGREDSDEKSAQVSLEFRDVNFLGNRLDPFGVEMRGGLDHLEFVVPHLKLSEESRPEIVLEHVFGEISPETEDFAGAVPVRSLGIGILKSGKLQIEEIEAEFEFAENGMVQINHLSGNILGGRMECEPFAFEPGHPEFALSMRFTGLSIKEAGQVIADFQGEAEGSLKGVLVFQIGREDVHLVKGSFELEGEQPARLQYSLKERLTKGLEPDSAEFLEINRVQEYLTDISVHSLQIELSDPRKNAKPILVRVVGDPQSNDGPVDIELALQKSEFAKSLHKWIRLIETFFLTEIQNSSL